MLPQPPIFPSTATSTNAASPRPSPSPSTARTTRDGQESPRHATPEVVAGITPSSTNCPTPPSGCRRRVPGGRSAMIELAECTSLGAGKLARSPRSVVLLPRGAIEQHGPHLPLLVDWMGAEELARLL